MQRRSTARRNRWLHGAAALGGLLALGLLLAAGAGELRVARRVDLLHQLPREQGKVEPVAVGGATRRAVVPGPQGFTIPSVAVPANGHLRFRVAVRPEVWQRDGDGVTFRVSARRGRETWLLYSRYVDPKSRRRERRWLEAAVPLSRKLRRGDDLPREVDLLFSTSPGFRGDARHDAPLWADLTIEERRWDWPAPWSSPPLNVVLISIDTLRADRLGAYGHPGGLTPRLDEVAAQSARFLRAYAPANHTLESHMSMMTGLYPKTHGVMRGTGSSRQMGVEPLPEGRVTLAETLRAHGYATAGFAYGCVWLGRKFGFAQGFDRYAVRPYDAARMNEGEIFPWLADHHRDPFFLFVHFYDVHSDWKKLPYDAPPEFRSKHAGEYAGAFDGCEQGTCATRYLMKLDRERVRLADEDLAYVRALYDAGIAATDHQVGRLIDRLDALGVLDRTLLVITSDHGEELRDHGRFIHTQLYEEVARVPLFLRLPGRIPSVDVDDRSVALLDVMPTILDVAGIAPEAPAEGRSLLPLLRREEVAERPIFAVGRNMKSVVDWPWKLIRVADREELYQLEEDPLEQVDRSAAQPDEVARLRRLMRDWHNAPGPAAAQAARPATVDASDAEIERLRALGYLD